MIDPASSLRPPRASSRDGVCLVTGASGFIGGRLAQRLVADGRPVRCLVRETSDTSRLDGLDLELVVGDLTSPHSLGRATEGCRHVFHCAARVSDWATVAEMQATNVRGTRSLLQACVDAGVERVIHISSTDVYAYPGGTAIDETYAATRFANWYAQTKLAAEAEVRRAQATHGLPAVILRPATVYGPGSTEVIGEIARAIRGGHMLLVDHGRAVAGLCYIDNLIDAALLAVEHEAATGQAFNVSDGLDTTWKQLTDDLAGGLGCPPVRWSLPYRLANGIGFTLEHGYRLLRRATRLHTPALLSRQAVQVLGLNQDFSNGKARGVLGWEPRVDYPTGLASTLAWLRGECL